MQGVGLDTVSVTSHLFAGCDLNCAHRGVDTMPMLRDHVALVVQRSQRAARDGAVDHLTVDDTASR